MNRNRVNLMQLVEEAVDGCWVGHRARQAISDDTGIGSVYSPPQVTESSRKQNHVETVVDIGRRPGVSKLCAPYLVKLTEI